MLSNNANVSSFHLCGRLDLPRGHIFQFSQFFIASFTRYNIQIMGFINIWGGEDIGE